MIDDFVRTYWRSARTPMNVRVHCYLVAEVAKILAEKAHAKGIQADETIIVQAALLHDTYRAINFRTIEIERLDPKEMQDVEFWHKQKAELMHYDHAEYMAIVLDQDGHNELAQIVRKHEITSVNKPETAPRTMEEKIVFIADKHVAHGEVVTFETRILEAKKRHRWSKEQIERLEKTWDKVRALEKELFSVLSCTAEELLKLNEKQPAHYDFLY